MLHKNLLAPCLGLALALGACGGDDDTSDDTGDAGDAGRITTDGGTDAGRGVLQSGTYLTSNLRTIDAGDGCDLDLEGSIAEDGGVFSTHELQNTGLVLNLGRRYANETTFSWDPPGYTLGSGNYTSETTASLTLDTQQTFKDDSCSHKLVRKSEVTYTGVNKVSVIFTHTESNFNAQCNAQLYPTTGCTSHYAFDLTKQ